MSIGSWVADHILGRVTTRLPEPPPAPDPGEIDQGKMVEMLMQQLRAKTIIEWASVRKRLEEGDVHAG